MAILSRSTLRNFFKNGDKPNQNNFWDWMDSFFHKTEDKIPMTSVTDLTETLNGKANHIALTAESMVREETDTHLQEQIDLLSDVKPLPAIRGIVTGSPADLENIDTSGFQDGDGYLVTNHDDYTEFYRYNAEEDEWDPSYQWKPLSAVRGVVNNHRDLNSIRNPHTEDSCIVKSDETRNNHTTCYSWNDNWEFVCEWIPGEGGSGTGEGNQNLATANLYQTDRERTYFLEGGRLTFDNSDGVFYSQLVMDPEGLNLNINGNGIHGYAIMNEVGLMVGLSSGIRNSSLLVGMEEFRFQNDSSVLQIGGGTLNFMFKDELYEKGIQMNGSELKIISKLDGMPANITLDGTLRCTDIQDVEPMLPMMPDVNIAIADDSGYILKMKMAKLAELLKPYLQD